MATVYGLLPLITRAFLRVFSTLWMIDCENRLFFTLELKKFLKIYIHIYVLNYLHIHIWIRAAYPSLLCFSQCYHNKGRQGYFRVITTEATLKTRGENEVHKIGLLSNEKKKSVYQL